MHQPWYSVFYTKSPIAKIVWGIAAVIIAMIVILFIGVTEETRMEAQTASWNGRSIEQGADIYINNCAECHGPEGRGGAAPALASNYFFTERLDDLGFAGSQHDFIALSVAAGRPSKPDSQWATRMPTWSHRYGGPLRDDQVLNVTAYVMNWEEQALAQTPEEDPWISYLDVASDLGPSGIPREEAAAPEEGESREPGDIFISLGCIGCHNVSEPQTDTNRGPVGPNLGNLHETAETRVDGMDAFDYVHMAITDPAAHTVEGYQPNVMPEGLDERMTDEELTWLVEWLIDPLRTE